MLQKGTMVQLQSRHAAGHQSSGAGPSGMDVNMSEGDKDLARALAASLAGANTQAAAAAGDERWLVRGFHDAPCFLLLNFAR